MTGQRAGMFILFLLVIQNFWVSQAFNITLSVQLVWRMCVNVYRFRSICSKKIMCLVNLMESCQGHEFYLISKRAQSYVFQARATNAWWILRKSITNPFEI